MRNKATESHLASVYRGEMPREWDLFVKEAAEEGLASFFFHHLSTSRIALSSPAPLEALKQGFLLSVVRHLRFEQALVQILKACDRGGLSCLVLKGMALAYLVYPDPVTRTMADIDLLIRSQDIRRAAGLLEGLGYRSPQPYETYREELIRFGGELAFYREGDPPVYVELHWRLEQYERLKGLVRIDEESVWQRAISYPVDGIQAKTLCPEDQLLALSIHFGLVHRLKGFKWLLDFDRLVRTFGGQIDWKRLVDRARGWGISHLLGHILWLSRRTFGTPLPSDVSVGPVFLGARGNLGQWVFLDRWPDRLRILKRAFWPSGDWLRFRYRLKKGEVIFPYRVLHPVRLLFGRLPHE